MSCELKAFISVFILSAIALHLNCRSFSSTPEREALGNSSKSSFRVSNEFANETGSSRKHQSSALEFEATNSNSKRIRRASSNRYVSEDSSKRNRNETLPLHSDKNLYGFRSNDSASIHSNNENPPFRSFQKRALEIEDGFRAPGVLTS